jgi:hypothetical protein
MPPLHIISKYLESKRVEALIEERVTRCQEHQVTPLTRDHDPTSHGAPEQDLRLHCVKLSQNFYCSHQIVVGFCEQTGDLVQDPLDFPRFTRDCRGEPVIHFDDTDRLHERGRAARRNVEQETWKLSTGRGADRQTVAVASHRRRGVGHHLFVGPANALELGQHVGSRPCNPPSQATELRRSVVSNRPVAPELRSYPFNQFPGIGKSTQNVIKFLVFGRIESTTDRCHPAGKGEQGDEVARFGRRRRILLEPGDRLVNSSQRQHAVFFDQVCDSHREKSGSGAFRFVTREQGKIFNDNAAHARARVGRDQFEHLVELQLDSERSVYLSRHEYAG